MELLITRISSLLKLLTAGSQWTSFWDEEGRLRVGKMLASVQCHFLGWNDVRVKEMN